MPFQSFYINAVEYMINNFILNNRICMMIHNNEMIYFVIEKKYLIIFNNISELYHYEIFFNIVWYKLIAIK